MFLGLVTVQVTTAPPNACCDLLRAPFGLLPISAMTKALLTNSRSVFRKPAAGSNPCLLLVLVPALADIIVDPFFTDAFIQQPSNPTYNALLAALPRAFVGTAAELRKMVALLTAESIKAYAEKVGLVLLGLFKESQLQLMTRCCHV